MKIKLYEFIPHIATGLFQIALFALGANYGAGLAIASAEKDYSVIAEQAAESVLAEFKKHHAVIIVQENDASYLTKKVRVTWPNEKTGG